jgi:hypothetical protein
VAGGTGLFGGFFYNLRSSYLPIVCLAYLAFVVLLWTQTEDADSSIRLRRTIVALTGFSAGIVIFFVLFTLPLTRRGTSFNLAHHVIGHPLVLSLALPPNDLSKREGIQWSDMVGLDIARRVDPNVTYLGPTYDQALLSYYRDLWKRYPLEMLGIYFAKWQRSNIGMFPFIDSNKSLMSKLLLTPARVVPNGVWITAAFSLIALAAMYLGYRYDPSAGMIIAVLSIAGALISIESAIIIPDFYVTYHNALLFSFFFINVLAYQAGANALYRLLTGRSFLHSRTGRSATDRSRKHGSERKMELANKSGVVQN